LLLTVIVAGELAAQNSQQRFHRAAFDATAGHARRPCAASGRVLRRRRSSASASSVESEGVGEVVLNGYSRPVAAFSVIALKALVRPAID